MITEIILIWFAIIYYVFCVVFLYENLQEGTNSIIDTIIKLVFILIIAPFQTPILLAIFLSIKYKKMME